VWQQFEVGFVPSDGLQVDAGQAAEVKKAAEQTAADGAARAGLVGFSARGAAVESAPAWKAIVDVGEEHVRHTHRCRC
jgi:hypothetical protein